MIRKLTKSKYSRFIDKYLYELSLDNSFLDESLGNAESFGWYGLIINDNPDELIESVAKYAGENNDVLTDDEKELLRSSAGFIIDQCSQGFVTVTEYSTKAVLDEVWADLKKEWEKYDAEAG